MGIFCQEYRCFPGNRSKQSSAAPDFETCRAHCDFFFTVRLKYRKIFKRDDRTIRENPGKTRKVAGYGCEACITADQSVIQLGS